MIRDHNLGAWGACEHWGGGGMRHEGWQECHPGGNGDRKRFIFKVTCLYYSFQLNTTYLVASTYFSHSWVISDHQAFLWTAPNDEPYIQLSPILPNPFLQGEGSWTEIDLATNSNWATQLPLRRMLPGNDLGFNCSFHHTSKVGHDQLWVLGDFLW